MAGQAKADVVAQLAARLEREKARRELAGRNWVPHAPFAKQAEFMALPHREALFGGAAGGGKSDAMLMDAAQWAHVPGYSALILRRTHAELVLSGALLDRSHTWWDSTPARWNGAERRWTFPSGATIEFGYFDAWDDRRRYMGAQWNRIYFDELTQFSEEWYRFMFTRIRRGEGVKVPSAMRGATNPGNIGHRWVKARFIDNAGQVRAFLPSTFRDNPHVDHDDYERNLAEAPPIVRRQMLGEWVEDGIGRVYGEYSAERNDVAGAPSGGEWTYVLGIDFGIVDPNAFSILGWRAHDPTLYVLEAFRKEGDPLDVIAEVESLSARYRFARIVGDVGGMGKAFATMMIERSGIPVEAAEKHNKLGYITLLNGDLAKQRLRIVRPKCEDLVAEWETLQWAAGARKENASQANHVSDATSYAWRCATHYAERPELAPRVRSRVEQIEADTARAWAETEAEIERERRERKEEERWEF